MKYPTFVRRFALAVMLDMFVCRLANSPNIAALLLATKLHAMNWMKLPKNDLIRSCNTKEAEFVNSPVDSINRPVRKMCVETGGVPSDDGRVINDRLMLER